MKTVLFVDDEKLTLELIERKFASSDIKCFFSNNAEEAVNILKNNNIDVLVSDIMMPNTTGLELVRIAKNVSPNTLRIVLSGNSQVSSIIDAVNTGNIYKYIVKPWKIDNEAIKFIEDAIRYSKELRRESMIKTNDLFVKLQDILDFVKDIKCIVADEDSNLIAANYDEPLPYNWKELKYSIINTQNGYLKLYLVK